MYFFLIKRNIRKVAVDSHKGDYKKMPYHTHGYCRHIVKTINRSCEELPINKACVFEKSKWPQTTSTRGLSCWTPLSTRGRSLRPAKNSDKWQNVFRHLQFQPNDLSNHSLGAEFSPLVNFMFLKAFVDIIILKSGDVPTFCEMVRVRGTNSSDRVTNVHGEKRKNKTFVRHFTEFQ